MSGKKKKIAIDQLKMVTSIYVPYCLNFKKMMDCRPFCLGQLKGDYDIYFRECMPPIKKQAKYKKC